ncbi:Akr7a2 [Symbiodinium natans]|uniref:Akr7a2 protein n=1 Tax=Symbiodinium natans TaxID=878477 RepID=A0A812NPA5_9DINO|nr:Akr7a2 [Symbiodinium natans]
MLLQPAQTENFDKFTRAEQHALWCTFFRNRLVEEELLPVLRKHGVSFVAYNPLAAGLLTGKHTDSENVLPGRFKENQNYLPRFYTKPNFEALAGIRKECAEAGISMVSASYAWLLRHSVLSAEKGDGLLIGASSLAQLDENLKACFSPQQLPPSLVSAFDAAWPLVSRGGDVFPYWRSYSKDQPGRDTLHPGASYSAAKK